MNLRGYIFSRDFSDGSFVDQSIQNSVIRQACEKNLYNFKLSATEYGMKNCFLMLEKLIEDLKSKNIDGLAFYSIYQLPAGEIKKKLFDIVLKKKKKIFFSKQDILVKNKNDINKLDELISLIDIQKNCLKKIDNFV
jgi:sporadic carbohydrate cluster protein (TIGR04323 family)|tara:strand:+ start:149 stop:559 length:411 start_codon:yes stop_codon:yes gene_type:complete